MIQLVSLVNKTVQCIYATVSTRKEKFVISELEQLVDTDMTSGFKHFCYGRSLNSFCGLISETSEMNRMFS